MRTGNAVTRRKTLGRIASWLMPMLLLLAITTGAHAQGGGFLVITPAGGENFVVDSTVQIRWLAQGVTGQLNIEYSVDSGAVWKRIDSVTARAGLDSLAWVVPNDTSRRALVRISSADGTKTARSRRVFSITLKPLPALTVVSPNGGELFGADSTIKIRWNATNITGDLLVDYSIDSGKIWRPIKTVAARSGPDTLLWSGPHDTTNLALVRVMAVDSSIRDASNRAFSIRGSVNPKVKVLFPNGGEVFQADSTTAIKWQMQDITGQITIELSTDNGAKWTIIGSKQARTGVDSLPWKTPNDSTTKALIRVSNNQLRDTSDAVFTINPRPPVSLKLLYPNGGEKFVIDSTIAIVWNSKNNKGMLAMNFSSDGGATWRLIDSVAPHPGNDSMVWTVPRTLSKNARLAIVTADSLVSDITDAPFSIVSADVGPSDGVDYRSAAAGALAAYPNPAAGETDLRWEQRNAGDAIVSIYDRSGRLLVTATAGHREPGEQHYRLVTTGLPAGAYLVEVRSGTNRANCVVTLTR
ncbi:MAG: T9SS type A sorting domain-containing protein [Candidatus Kapaibacterium sp.]